MFVICSHFSARESSQINRNRLLHRSDSESTRQKGFRYL